VRNLELSTPQVVVAPGLQIAVKASGVCKWPNRESRVTQLTKSLEASNLQLVMKDPSCIKATFRIV